MTILLGILLTLLILSLVVFIHEMGHFLTARFTGMKVEEFGIGIPPLAKKLFVDKKGTAYTLNWLPIGGFVRIKGEDPSSDEATDTDSFSAKKWWARVLVLIAGVTMNFVLAWVIFSGLLWHGSSPLAVNFLIPKNYNSYFLPSLEESLESGYVKHTGIVLEPLVDGSADRQGIKKGDILTHVDGVEISSIDQLIARITLNTPMEFSLKKGDSQGEYKVVIAPMNGKIQSYLRYSNLEISKDFRRSFGFFESLGKGLSETVILSRVTLDFLGKTVSDLIQPKTPADREMAKEMIAGPIGMGAGMVQLVKIGVSFEIVFLMIAFLSINLGVLNILPFPALDGGRLLSTTIMSIVSRFTQRKKTLQTFEQTFHALGMVLLIILSLAVAFLDILKL